MNTPTLQTYNGLNQAYDFFNERLFASSLPSCLITMQRKNRTYGYFAGGRFGTRDGKDVTDEIALNPSHFKTRTTEQSLSTLVHEMTHLWQHHHGQAPRVGYHSREWAAKMRSIGLIPTDTGAPGGRETGQHVSHYIEAGGSFDHACVELLSLGFTLPYVELWGEKEVRTLRKKAASKTRYACPVCSLNAWGKPAIHLICGYCNERMSANAMF
jgi:hypothetical protein